MPRKNRQSALEAKVSTEGKLAVSKMDAAVRQLQTAIELWFYDKDPVSIAALAHAGYQVIYDINLRRRGEPMHVMTGKEFVKEEYQKDYEQFARATPNFLKHARADSDKIHYFSPGVAPLVMIEAILAYERLTKVANPVFRSFFFWMVMEHPQLMSEETKRLFETIGDSARTNALKVGKREYYEQALPTFVAKFKTGLSD